MPLNPEFKRQLEILADKPRIERAAKYIEKHKLDSSMATLIRVAMEDTTVPPKMVTVMVRIPERDIKMFRDLAERRQREVEQEYINSPKE